MLSLRQIHVRRNDDQNFVIRPSACVRACVCTRTCVDLEVARSREPAKTRGGGGPPRAMFTTFRGASGRTRRFGAATQRVVVVEETDGRSAVPKRSETSRLIAQNYPVEWVPSRRN